jgi:predicted RNA-binding protein with TRAM domain
MKFLFLAEKFQCDVDISLPMSLSLIYFDLFMLKRPRRHEKYVNKDNHFGGSKAPRYPISVGEEYIVTIDEMGKEGSGVASLRGVSIVVNNTNPGDKVKVRITKLGRSHATAEVFG